MSSMTSVVRANLKAIVSAYRKQTRASLAQVSKKFYGNVGFLAAFFAGEQSVSLAKADDMIERIKAEWPAGVEWPYCRAVIIAPPKPRRRG